MSTMGSCRICLNKDKKQYSLYLKPKPSTIETFAKMLTEVTSVKVFIGDGLPQKICITCSAVLIKAYKLKVLAEKTDKALKEKVLKNKAISNTRLKMKPFFEGITEKKVLLNKNNLRTKLKVVPKSARLEQNVAAKITYDNFFNDSKGCKKVLDKTNQDTFFTENLDDDNNSDYGEDVTVVLSDDSDPLYVPYEPEESNTDQISPVLLKNYKRIIKPLKKSPKRNLTVWEMKQIQSKKLAMLEKIKLKKRDEMLKSIILSELAYNMET